MRIQPNVASPASIKPATPNPTQESGDFGQMLMDVLREVNESQTQARAAQNALLTGQPVETHDVLIAMEKGSIAMQLTLQVRNKLLEAYQEISRMQI